MAINPPSGFASIYGVIEQQNYLETMLRQGMKPALVLRQAVSKRIPDWFDARIGETKTFTRSNPISPSTTPLNPASNTGLDNGISVSTRGFEQWQAQLYSWPGGVNLNLLSNETLSGDVYLDNMIQLGLSAGNSVELVCVQRAFTAYDSGDTFALALGSSATDAHVDNINGFDTQYLSTLAPSYGLPAAVSSSNKMPVMILSKTDGSVVSSGALNVTLAAADVSNISYMQSGALVCGRSGHLTLDSAQTWVAGDRFVAMDANNPSTTAFNSTYKDGSFVIRPLDNTGAMIGSAYNMAVGNTIVPSIQIPQAVAMLARRGVPRLSNDLYGCEIDSTLLGQFYSDPGFQRATMGSFDRSRVFANGIIAEGWGVEFVPATQIPVYNAPAGGFSLRHAFVFGEDVVSEHPFIGMKNAVSRAAAIGDIVDTRVVDRIEFISQSPLDRLNQQWKLSYNYVGDFEPGTDKGTNPNVINTSDWCRFKRGEIIQAASPV